MKKLGEVQITSKVADGEPGKKSYIVRLTEEVYSTMTGLGTGG